MPNISSNRLRRTTCGLKYAGVLVFFASIVVTSGYYYAFNAFEPVPEPLGLAVGIGFLVLLFAPVVVCGASLIHMSRGSQGRRMLHTYAIAFAVTLLFNPFTQLFLDWRAMSLLRHAESLHLRGMSEGEVIALFGQPSYVLATDSPGVVQLRYRQPLPMLLSSEFLVELSDGHATHAAVDDG